MKYVYPAVFTHDEDMQILVSVPDLPGCHTFGQNLQEAIEMTRDAVAMWLCIAEDKNETIPTPDMNILKSYDCDFTTLIDVDTVLYRKNTNTKSVKKTLSIPEWLNDMALKENINFSNVLQNALMEQLHI